MIEDYFHSLLDFISSLPFVQLPEINLEIRGDTVGLIRGKLNFTDGSLLHFRELIDLRIPLNRVMYSYHYLGMKGELIFRYDNTEHFPGVPSFPHHKHVGENEVIPSTAPDLMTVLREIEEMLS